ncbi:MAG: hypothetical protein HQL88_05945 [Magnetococcales bacterium]|nr:hypothetical protein [Magnetococcales bacterium]
MRSPTHGRFGRSSLRMAVAGMLLLLAGCGPEGSGQRADVENELYANDDILQTVQRHMAPATYWQEKNQRLRERVQKHQEAFNEQAQAYHALLNKRRVQVTEAIAQAKKAGKSADEARRLVIQEFRATLDPIREETRRLGKELRRAMALLAQADSAARQ